MPRIWRDKETNNFMINRHAMYNSIIVNVFIYEKDGTTYDITNEFYDIKKDINLSAYLLQFPRFSEEKTFIVQNKREKKKDKPNCNLYIPKGKMIRICA